MLSSAHTPSILKKKQQASNSFIEGVFSRTYLQVNDTVFINIPEDLLINGLIPPEYNGRIATVQSVDDIEVVVQLMDDQDTIYIPIFCLCLQSDVLLERMNMEGLYTCTFTGR